VTKFKYKGYHTGLIQVKVRTNFLCLLQKRKKKTKTTYHSAAGDLGLKNKWGVTRTLINKRGRRSYFHGLIFG